MHSSMLQRQEIVTRWIAKGIKVHMSKLPIFFFKNRPCRDNSNDIRLF